MIENPVKPEIKSREGCAGSWGEGEKLSQAWPRLTHLCLLPQVVQGCQILLCWLHPFDSHLDISEHGEIRDQPLVVLQTHLLAELDLQNQTGNQSFKLRQKRRQNVI